MEENNKDCTGNQWNGKQKTVEKTSKTIEKINQKLVLWKDQHNGQTFR